MKTIIQKTTFVFLVSAIIISNTFPTSAQTVKRITAGTNLQTEIDNAVDGTTFLVEPGSYGHLNITKRVALIGNGYFLNSGGITGVTSIDFEAGSDNSIVTGFSINGRIEIGANGITLQRNHCGEDIIVGVLDSYYRNAGGNTIKQNFINGYVNLRGSSSSGSSNTLIKNNIILGDIRQENNYNSGVATNNTILNYNGCSQEYNSGSSLAFTSNIVVSTCNFSTSSYPNGRYSTNSTFSNNLIKTTHFITNDASNVKVVNFSNVFVGYPNNNGSTLDGRYQLLSNSPAKNIGIGNTEAGAFGGSEPYVLQGIPIGPNVISVVAPTGAAAGQIISVTIRAKTQN